MQTDYSEIIQAYPPVITLEQLYQICHISKRKAKWLLEKKLIPCQDSGKKTRRFKIRTEDVVAYLMDQTANPEKYRAPVGMFNASKCESSVQDRFLQAKYFAIDSNHYRTYISKLWKDLPDALTITDIQKHSGLNRDKVIQWLLHSKIEGILMRSKYIIIKESLINQIVLITLLEPSQLTAKLMNIAISYMERRHE